MKTFLRISIILTVTLVLLLPGGGVASAQGEGTITGLVTNGTDGGTVPDGQVVTLTTYNGSTQLDKTQTNTDAVGYFTFDNLDTTDNLSYQLSTNYLNVSYLSDMLQFSNNTTDLSAELPIYETENSTDPIRVVTSHIIMYPSGNQMDVLEYYLFLNSSDRTYVGTSSQDDFPISATLSFSLPDGAQGLQPQVGFDQSDTLPTTGGFALTTPIPPGMQEVGFSYATSLDNGSFTYQKNLNYPIDALDLLVSGTDTKVTSAQMVQNQNIQMADTTFQDFSADNLTAGQQLQIVLSPASSSTSPGALILIIVVVILLAGGIIYIMYSRRKNTQEPAPQYLSETDSDLLLRRLARLDDDHEDGIIDETEYRKERNDLKARLAELLAEEKNTTED